MIKLGIKGFTLLELLLSMAIMTVLLGISLPIYYSFQSRNDLDTTTQSVASALRQAQGYSRSMKRDNVWSVEIQSTAVTVFMGTVFATRDTGFDETATIPGSVTLSGMSEIQFAKLTGIPNTSGTITLTSNSGDSRTITVNAKGVIDY